MPAKEGPWRRLQWLIMPWSMGILTSFTLLFVVTAVGKWPTILQEALDLPSLRG